MQLHDWLSARNIDDDAFADMVGGVSAHAVRKWRYRERIPRSEEQKRIYAVTEGGVTPNDFVGVGPIDATAEQAGATSSEASQ